eukprot:g454.t1
MVVRVTQIIQHMLKNPESYPGPHNKSQPRTSQAFQPLDPERQLRLIYDALVLRLKELLAEGCRVFFLIEVIMAAVAFVSLIHVDKSSVSIENLGAFSFAPAWHNAKYGPDFVSKVPCFVPHKKLQVACPNYKPSTQRLELDTQALTTAQSVPAKVRFLNEVLLVPLASGCYYKAEVVKSAMKQFFIAVIDLAERGYDIELDLADVVVFF